MNVKYILSAALVATLPSLMHAQTGPDATTVERNSQPPTSIATKLAPTYAVFFQIAVSASFKLSEA